MQDTLTNIFNKTTNSDLGLFGTLTSRTYNATATAQDFNKIFENLNIQTGEKSKNLTTNPMSEKNIYEKDFSNLTREPNKNTKNITDSKNGFNRNNNLKETTSSDFEKQDKTNSTKYVSDDNSTSDAKNVKYDKKEMPLSDDFDKLQGEISKTDISEENVSEIKSEIESISNTLLDKNTETENLSIFEDGFKTETTKADEATTTTATSDEFNIISKLANEDLLKELKSVLSNQDLKEIDSLISKLPTTEEQLNLLNKVEDAIKSLKDLDVTQPVQNTNQNQNNILKQDLKELNLTNRISKNGLENTNLTSTQTEQSLQELNKNIFADMNEAMTGDIATPVVKVAQDIVAKTQTQSAIAETQIKDLSPKEIAREILQKAILTQEVLNETNAKITNVEFSQSNNLLNNQMPQDQSARLAFETSNNLLTNSTNEIKSANFSKVLETSQGKDLNKTDILSQINSKLDNLKQEGTTKLTMILKPESLGRITLELVNSKEGLTAKMMTESSQVKELLDKSLDGLKNTLSSQGINVNNVEVKVSQLDNSSNTSFSMFKENGSETGFFNGNSQGFSKNSEENRNQKGYEESLAHTISKQDDDENQNTIIHNGNADYKV